MTIRWLRTNDSWQLLTLLLLTVVLRGGALWLDRSALDADPDGYRGLAVTLAQYGVFGSANAEGVTRPTAFRPPLYPWLLSWLVIDGQLPGWRVALLHLVLGVATVAATLLLGRRLIGNIAWLAALVVAVDPVLVVQSTQVMTETLAVSLAVAVWLVWVSLADRLSLGRPWPAAAMVLAVLLALAFLCRPTFVVWAALLCAWLVGWSAVKRTWRPAAASLVVMAVVAVVIGAWSERNRRAIGHPVWATSHGGYTLLLGNNPLFYEYLRGGHGVFGTAWDAEPFHRAWASRYRNDPEAADFWQQPHPDPVAAPRVDDEVADDAIAYQAARRSIAQQPQMFRYSVLVRIARLWSPIPQATPQRGGAAVVAVAAFYLVLLGAVVYGAWRRGRRLLATPWIAGLLLALSLTMVHAVYWSNLRMRAPAVPWLALVAASGLASRRDER